MRKPALILLLIIFSLSACKDNLPTPTPTYKQYSTWIINNDTFSSNNAEVSIGENVNIARIWNHDLNNNFRLGFYIPYLPTVGSWPLSNLSNEDPNYAYLSFYYHTKFYIVSSDSHNELLAGSANGKVHYQLSPTWYINYDDHDDSVLIQATINEP